MTGPSRSVTPPRGRELHVALNARPGHAVCPNVRRACTAAPRLPCRSACRWRATGRRSRIRLSGAEAAG